MKHITIRLEDGLHEFLRRTSFDTRKSINRIVVELIKKLKTESN